MPKDKLAEIAGKTFSLVYSQHALDESKVDRYGTIQTFKKLTVSEKNIVELSIEEGFGVCKLLVRMAYNAFNEVCYVIEPKGNTANVKTCWLCRKNDRHTTLNRSLYETI